MNLILKFANHGVIHGDFNEFNIMVTDDGNPIIIDFPQVKFSLLEQLNVILKFVFKFPIIITEIFYDSVTHQFLI